MLGSTDAQKLYGVAPFRHSRLVVAKPVDVHFLYYHDASTATIILHFAILGTRLGTGE